MTCGSNLRPGRSGVLTHVYTNLSPSRISWEQRALTIIKFDLVAEGPLSEAHQIKSARDTEKRIEMALPNKKTTHIF